MIYHKEYGLIPDSILFSHFKLDNFLNIDFDKYQKPILIIGDSQAFGATLRNPNKERFSSILAQLLPDYNVLNISCPAWGTEDEYLFYEKKLKIFSADFAIIILTHFVNDVVDDYKDFPNFSKKLNTFLGWSYKYVIPPFVIPLSLFIEVGSKFSGMVQKLKFENFCNSCRILCLESSFSKSIWDKHFKVLRAFKDAVGNEKFHILSIIPPIDIKKVCMKCGIYGSRCMGRIKMERINQKLKTFFESEKIHYISLYDEMKKYDNPSTFFAGDLVHLNASGHKFVADILYSYLQSLSPVSQQK